MPFIYNEDGAAREQPVTPVHPASSALSTSSSAPPSSSSSSTSSSSSAPIQPLSSACSGGATSSARTPAGPQALFQRLSPQQQLQQLQQQQQLLQARLLLQSSSSSPAAAAAALLANYSNSSTSGGSKRIHQLLTDPLLVRREPNRQQQSQVQQQQQQQQQQQHQQQQQQQQQQRQQQQHQHLLRLGTAGRTKSPSLLERRADTAVRTERKDHLQLQISAQHGTLGDVSVDGNVAARRTASVSALAANSSCPIISKSSSKSPSLRTDSAAATGEILTTSYRDAGDIAVDNSSRDQQQRLQKHQSQQQQQPQQTQLQDQEKQLQSQPNPSQQQQPVQQKRNNSINQVLPFLVKQHAKTLLSVQELQDRVASLEELSACFRCAMDSGSTLLRGSNSTATGSPTHEGASHSEGQLNSPWQTPAGKYSQVVQSSKPRPADCSNSSSGGGGGGAESDKQDSGLEVDSSSTHSRNSQTPSASGASSSQSGTANSHSHHPHQHHHHHHLNHNNNHNHHHQQQQQQQHNNSNSNLQQHHYHPSSSTSNAQLANLQQQQQPPPPPQHHQQQQDLQQQSPQSKDQFQSQHLNPSSSHPANYHARHLPDTGSGSSGGGVGGAGGVSTSGSVIRRPNVIHNPHQNQADELLDLLDQICERGNHLRDFASTQQQLQQLNSDFVGMGDAQLLKENRELKRLLQKTEDEKKALKDQIRAYESQLHRLQGERMAYEDKLSAVCFEKRQLESHVRALHVSCVAGIGGQAIPTTGVVAGNSLAGTSGAAAAAAAMTTTAAATTTTIPPSLAMMTGAGDQLSGHNLAATGSNPVASTIPGQAMSSSGTTTTTNNNSHPAVSHSSHLESFHDTPSVNDKVSRVLQLENPLELKRQLIEHIMDNAALHDRLRKLEATWAKRHHDWTQTEEALQSHVDDLMGERDECISALRKNQVDLRRLRSRLTFLESAIHKFDASPVGTTTIAAGRVSHTHEAREALDQIGEMEPGLGPMPLPPWMQTTTTGPLLSSSSSPLPSAPRLVQSYHNNPLGIGELGERKSPHHSLPPRVGVNQAANAHFVTNNRNEASGASLLSDQWRRPEAPGSPADLMSVHDDLTSHIDQICSEFDPLSGKDERTSAARGGAQRGHHDYDSLDLSMPLQPTKLHSALT